MLGLWSDPEVVALIARAGSTYATRRERFLRALEERGLRASGRSGLNVWIPVDDETAAVGALLQRGWVVAPGAAYRLQGSSPAVRVTTASLYGEEAERLAEDLREALLSGPAGRAA